MNQTKQATILVVDDKESNRKLLEALLDADGHAVRMAASRRVTPARNSRVRNEEC